MEDFIESLEEYVWEQLDKNKDKFNNRDDVYNFIYELKEDMLFNFEQAIEEISYDYCKENEIYDEENK